MTWQFIMAIGIGLAASAEDLVRRQVSNWIPIVALFAGLVIHYSERGWPGVWSSFLGACCGFGVFLVFYMLGGMGGGDVKLMAGFGAILGGATKLFEAAIWTGGIGAILAVGVLLYRFLTSRLSNPGDKAQSRFIPYAPAITLGVWLELVAKS